MMSISENIQGIIDERIKPVENVYDDDFSYSTTTVISTGMILS